MTNYGVTTDDDYTASHKRERITVWSPPFASTFEAEGFTLPKGDGYALTTYNGDRLIVRCETPRTDATFQAIDQAIAEALEAHYAAQGVTTLEVTR